MLVKNDRETDARDSIRNAEDGKHRQLIGRGSLLGPAPPRGRRLLHDTSRSHPSSRGPDILSKDNWQNYCTYTRHLHLVIYIEFLIFTNCRGDIYAAVYMSYM